MSLDKINYQMTSNLFEIRIRHQKVWNDKEKHYCTLYVYSLRKYLSTCQC